jgi:hypothetical protein
MLALAVHNTPHGSSAKGGVNRLRFSRSPGRGMKIATFNINNVNKRLAEKPRRGTSMARRALRREGAPRGAHPRLGTAASAGGPELTALWAVDL